LSKVGLDFGTTYTVLSHVDKNGNLEAKEPAEGISPLQPSIVARLENDKLEFGLAAKGYLGHAGVTTYTGFKMMLMEKGENVRRMGYDNNFSPKTISAKYLENVIANYLERTQQDSIEKLVVGVPEIWSSNGNLDECRKVVLQDILKKNEKIKEAQLVTEPEAACAYFVYNYKRNNNGKDFVGKLLLVDYGGGTLDIALCDVTQNGKRSEIKVNNTTGAGENQEGIIGKAGLAFLHGVVKLALSKGELSEEELLKGELSEEKLSEDEIISYQEFLECVDRFEQQLINSSKEIKKIFDDHKADDKEKIDDVFYSIKMNREMYPITYGMMTKVYNWIISPVLNKKLLEMKDYMDEQPDINYLDDPNDNFKIALVGGFCNFYLTQKQVENFFTKGPSVDRRFQDSIRDTGECEKAVSYGAALLANEEINLRITAPYSVGIEVKSGDMYFAINKYDVIMPNVPVKVRKGEGEKKETARFAGGKIPKIAFNFYRNKDNAKSEPVKEKYQERVDLTKDTALELAFSFDKSKMITLHKYRIDDPDSQDPKIVEEPPVFLGSIYELLGDGIIEIGGGKNV
jgi:molecular chaperone DnaK